MVLHRMTDYVGDLGVASVILLPQRMHDAPLHGLEPVLDGGNRPRADDVGGILPEVVVEKFAHRTRTGQSLRRGIGGRSRSGSQDWVRHIRHCGDTKAKLRTSVSP